MNWVRKLFVHLLAVILFASLLGAAFATSADVNLSHPAKIENWLSQSKIYDNFQSTIADGAKKSINHVDNPSGEVSASDLAVQQAVQSAFSTNQLQQYANSVIDSNYAWLEGKTATPNFTVDLTSAKQSFAQQVGQYVKTILASLPTCTAAQTAQLQNADPLSLTCRPANLTPQAAATRVTQQIQNSGDFLSDPVITPNNLIPGVSSNSKPYYQQFSQLPKLYRLGLKLPYILGSLAILCAIGVVFISPRRRRGVRKLAIVLLMSGALLVAYRLLANTILTKIENGVFNSKSVGQLQQAERTFGKLWETAIAKTNLYFGILYLILAVALFALLISKRQPKTQPASSTSSPVQPTDDDSASPVDPSTIKLAKPINRQPNMDIMGPKAKPTAPTLEPKTKQPPRPRRLIQ